MAFLIDDILLAPIHLVVWTARRLHEAATAEATDDSKVQEDLLALQMRHEMGEVSDEAFEREETRLLEVLEKMRNPN